MSIFSGTGSYNAIINALTKTPLVESSAVQSFPPPPPVAYYLLDDSGDNLVDDSGDLFGTP